MGILPGIYSPKVYRRVDWSRDIVLKDSTSSAVNLSGYTFSSSVWNKERSKKYCDMTVSITDSNNGKITMSMTEVQTTQLPDSCFYDLKSAVGNNTNYWLTGEINVQEGYTE